MNTWIPAFACKPLPNHKVKIKLANLDEVEGLYDMDSGKWIYETKGIINKPVLAWKKIEGEEYVGSKYGQSSFSESNNFA